MKSTLHLFLSFIFLLTWNCNGDDSEKIEIPIEVVNVQTVYLKGGILIRTILIQRGWEHIHNQLTLEWIKETGSPDKVSKKLHTTQIQEFGGAWALSDPKWDGKVFKVKGSFTYNSKVSRDFKIIPLADGKYKFEGNTNIEEKDLDKPTVFTDSY